MRDPLAKMPPEVEAIWDLREQYPVVSWTLPASRSGRVQALISPHSPEHVRQARAIIGRIAASDGWEFEEKPLAPGWSEIRATGPYGGKGVVVELAAFVPVERAVMPPPPPLPADPGQVDRPVEVTPLATLATHGTDGPPTRDMEAFA